MNASLIEADFQDKLKKAKCVEHIGPVENELKELVKGYENLIEELTLSEIDDKKLAKLNFKSGVREGLRLAIGIIDSMKDEILEGKAANSPSGVKRQ